MRKTHPEEVDFVQRAGARVRRTQSDKDETDKRRRSQEIRRKNTSDPPSFTHVEIVQITDVPHSNERSISRKFQDLVVNKIRSKSEWCRVWVCVCVWKKKTGSKVVFK